MSRVNRSDGPEYLYHGTSEGAARSIQRQGALKPGQAIGSSGKELFFTTDEYRAQYYATSKSSRNYLLRVRKTNSFVPDMDIVMPGDFKTPDSIPSSDIEIRMPNNEWVSLQEYDFDEKVRR